MSWRELRHAPGSLWAIMVVTFFDAYAYFAFSYVLILYLREDLGFDDQLAGLFYGIFGVCVSAFTLLLGHLVDTIRVKKALLIANGVGFVSRVVFGLTYNRVAASAALFVFMSASIAIGGPPVPTAIRRYTTAKTQSVAFSIQYVVMNVGAILAGPTVDALRTWYPAEGIGGFSRYGCLILVTSVLHLVDLLIVLLFVHDIDVDDTWEVRECNDQNRPRPNWRAIRELLRDKHLWRFVVLSLGAIGVRSTYRYLDALYPTFMERAPFNTVEHFPYMTLLGINPILVIVLTVPAGIFLARFHPYNVLLVGVAISSVSPLAMAAMQYWGVVVFIVLLTLGEIIWSPQMNNYVCWLAPEGKEGIFFSLATLPLFIAKLITGALTGTLLTNFCSSEVECTQGAYIWLIIALTTLTSPVILLATMRFVKVRPPEDRELSDSPTDGLLDLEEEVIPMEDFQ